LRSGDRDPSDDRVDPLARIRGVTMCDRYLSDKENEPTKSKQEKIARCRASSSQPMIAVIASFLSVIVLAFAIVFAGSPVRADENEIPILKEAKGVELLFLRASPFCPEPPAHLPANDFQLELLDSDAPIDPVTLELLASKDIRVEVTVLRGGLERGDSESYELRPLRGESPSNHRSEGDAIATSMTVGDLQPGVVYFARALILVENGWIPTRTIKFTTPICAVDGLDEEEVKP